MRKTRASKDGEKVSVKASSKLSNNKFTRAGIVVVLVVIAVVAAVLLVRHLRRTSAADLESNMKTMASRYFDEKIRGNVIGINKQIISVGTLEKAGYDISGLKDPESGIACDKENSFSYIIIGDPAETDYDKITYTVENHLSCGNYSSEKK